MKKRILITGISGQVGSILADFILENTDMEIIGLMRWQDPMSNLRHLTQRINRGDRIRILYADLNDPFSILRAINTCKPDWISHLAAQSFPKTSFDIPIETLQTNIIGTANILEAVRHLRDESNYSPIVHICSSSEVYGRALPSKPLDEETQFHASSPYSLSKIGSDYLGRFYAEAYRVRTFVTRMGTHSGRRRSDVFFESTVAKQIALIEYGLQEPILYVGSLESVRTFQDARDAVRAYFLLFQAAEEKRIEIGACFNIAGEEAFKLDEVVRILLDLSTKSDIKVMVDPNRLRPIDADYQMFDNTKIKSVINWYPNITVRAMFADLLDYWRNEIQSGNIPLAR